MSGDQSLREVRLKKLNEMRQQAAPVFPNDFRRDSFAGDLLERFGGSSAEELEQVQEPFSLAGRVMTVRDFGKSLFLHLQDETGLLQLYFQRQKLGDTAFRQLKRYLDAGDILGAQGRLFRTRTGELTLNVDRCQLLTKALRPLPEKFHGLRDVETRYRKRYLDLIVNPAVKESFRRRGEIIRRIRSFFDGRGFLEVETPMMHPMAGGAAARPFETHHNALDLTLFLRIAPELYLKRLLVGGLGKVYELNKQFRNEGLSTTHNPEFTMIEFYETYASYRDFMTLTEELFQELLGALCGSVKIPYQGTEIDFSPPWRRIPLEQALREQCGLSGSALTDREALRRFAREQGIELAEGLTEAEMAVELFEQKVESRLIQPTFVTDYPEEVSPLARSSDDRPGFVDRFELYVAGRELANGFSELNDPLEQRSRFERQTEKRRLGDESAHQLDEDFLEALEFGMPPAAGEGIGIDRLVMLLTDSASIRDVILFPQMRPERAAPGPE
ncbi:MAG: lysine--tRNA ligase [bacterium]